MYTDPLPPTGVDFVLSPVPTSDHDVDVAQTNIALLAYAHHFQVQRVAVQGHTPCFQLSNQAAVRKVHRRRWK
eukprot:11211446-Lingulodinium_polyedra.AAC.1